MMLRRLQQSGHKPIVLMGGGTTKVGDPTDKEGQRPLLTHDQIQGNIATIKDTFAKFLTFGDGSTDAVMVDNDEWLSKFGYVQFLRDYGVHFTINRMLAFDSVKARLDREQPMTFLEFNYMLMQSVDFLELERTHGCVLQMGGSDQWGNIVNGVELIRRVDQKPAFGLTTPLLSTASGQKMGKTVGGAVWLNADMRSPYDYWQFWRNTEDADVGRFMRLFTDLSLEEISNLEKKVGAELNSSKERLADECTRVLHGEEAAREAKEKAQRVFEEGLITETLEVVSFEWGEFEKRSGAALIRGAGLANNMKEAKDLIARGNATINNHPVALESLFSRSDVMPETGMFRIQTGKRRIKDLKPE
jgi:tyrosyl-tRNA synthetase